MGRITKDPEMRSMPNGTAVVKFSIATNHTYKNKAGEKVETAQFHNCVAFARIAEIIKQYTTKGQEAMVEGRIEYRQWQKQDGTKAYSTEIMVENFQMGARAKRTEQEPRPMTKSEIQDWQPTFERDEKGEIKIVETEQEPPKEVKGIDDGEILEGGISVKDIPF